jgi:hypothetical protein
VRIFRKHRRPEELGGLIYEALRKGMETQGDLSMERLLQSLSVEEKELDQQYAGEMIVGLMFGASMATKRSASQRVSGQINSGMKAEFFNHIAEQGASPVERAEWETIVAARFLAYEQCLEDYSGFEPPWRMGRQFYWNLLGHEEYNAMSIKIATLYLLTGRDASQELLNEHGPSLVVNKDSVA